MLTRILHQSPELCTFFNQLHIDMSQPQRRHILNLADALLVCEDTKTLAALQRQFIEAPDASNMADFLRISPWQADDVRTALRVNQLTWLINQAEALGLPKVLYINLDDSLGGKDKHTRHLDPVDWFHDHGEGSRKNPRFKNAFCYLICTLRVGRIVVTVDLRLYLRKRTVRRINRHRPPGQRVPFRSKYSLARAMLESLRPLLPRGWTIYVQFDSWYASEKLIKYVRRQGWHVTCGLKCNRKLNGKRIDQVAYALRHKRYTHVRVTAADGEKKTYYVRQAIGRLANIPHDVRVFFSKRHPREKSPAYFEYGSHSLGPTGLAGLPRALVMRNGQLLPEDPTGLGRLPSPLLRGGGQIHGRRTADLGLRRASLRARALRPDQDLRRHHPATSGRTRGGLVDRRLGDDARNQRCATGLAAFPAPGGGTTRPVLMADPRTSLPGGRGFPTWFFARASHCLSERQMRCC